MTVWFEPHKKGDDYLEAGGEDAATVGPMLHGAALFPECAAGFLCEIGGKLMRYLVKARLRSGQERELLRAIESESLGKGSVAGDEYLHNMREARLDEEGTATWVEVCFCETPLAEERPYWEEYFELVAVKDAHARRNCRDASGVEPWACCDCDCTRKLEERLGGSGESFLACLRKKAGTGNKAS